MDTFRLQSIKQNRLENKNIQDKTLALNSPSKAVKIKLPATPVS